ncbi:MAG: TetR/AcrR family transcriptional regulator [Acidobacteria bacterium]|nr:TetR/AcrR family transcriptional regulator [Acidobacteriota bacterium]
MHPHPHTPPAPKQRLSGDQRRAAIVQAALRLFAQNGFRGTTTKQLALAVGVSEPVLYKHFPSKRDLYSAIIEQLAMAGPEGDQVRVQFQQAAQQAEDNLFFLTIAEGILDWYVKDPARIRILLYSALEGHELSDLFYQRHILPFYQELSAYIERRMKEGVFREADPLEVARAFCGVIGQYGLDLTVFGLSENEARRTARLEMMIRIFLNGMKK